VRSYRSTKRGSKQRRKATNCVHKKKIEPNGSLVCVCV